MGPTEGTNDMNLFDRDCVKGYVYSKEDLAVDWKNVESHAAVAEEKGYKVMKKRWRERSTCRCSEREARKRNGAL